MGRCVVGANTRTHTHTHTHTYTYIHTHTHTHLSHTYTHMYTHMCVCVCMREEERERPEVEGGVGAINHVRVQPTNWQREVGGVAVRDVDSPVTQQHGPCCGLPVDA